MLKDLQATELGLPKMQDWLVTALNEANLTASVASRETHLSLLDRQRLKVWVKQFEEQLAPALPKLLSLKENSNTEKTS